MTRDLLLRNFLEKAGLAAAKRIPLASDASFRRYERIMDGDKSYMLMDAPPPKEDVLPFITIDQYLRKRHLSAPEIYTADEENGILLLEDFGDNSFTSLLASDKPKVQEWTLYQAAVDVLIQLGRETLPKKIPGFNDEIMLRECRLFIDWYLPNVEGIEVSEKDKQTYMDIWQKVLSSKRAAKDALVMRDYHADNLMWLADREGACRVGLLDFQDAVIGSPIYDLVSLLEDARRDVEPSTVARVIDYYLQERQSVDREAFYAQYALLAAQRNSKIIGIFARLAMRDAKPRYLQYLPRVWQHLDRDLEHPIMAPLRMWLNDIMTREQRDIRYFKYLQVA